MQGVQQPEANVRGVPLLDEVHPPEARVPTLHRLDLHHPHEHSADGREDGLRLILEGHGLRERVVSDLLLTNFDYPLGYN